MELGAHQAEEQPLPPLPTGSFWGLVLFSGIKAGFCAL